MRELDSAFIAEKNKPANRPIHLYELYDVDGLGTNLFYAAHDVNVLFGTNTYLKFPLIHESISESSEGEVQNVQLRVCNISRLIQAYLELYDLRGVRVVIKKVWMDQLEDPDNYMEDTYYIESYTANEADVIFSLAPAYNALDIILPNRTYWRNHCTWRFKDAECGYVGEEQTCNKTYQRCKELNNRLRFGGFPSVPAKTLFLR